VVALGVVVGGGGGADLRFQPLVLLEKLRDLGLEFVDAVGLALARGRGGLAVADFPARV